MILTQRLRYLIAVVLLVWLVILIKYLSHKPLRPQERDNFLLPNGKEVIDNEYTKTKSEKIFSSPTFEYKTAQKDTKGPYEGPENNEQKKIVDSFLHAWSAYKEYSWGFDELRPLSRSGNNWMNVGLTIVDSLDTLYIMGLKKEFELATSWISNNLKILDNGSVQFFEIVIRLLGGLLSAFHLSGRQVFLEVANLYGNALKGCFNGPTIIPCHRIFLGTGKGIYDITNLAEIGTIQLEFRDLGRATGIVEYEHKAMAVSEHIHGIKKFDGLLSCIFSTGSAIKNSVISFGAQCDSYYEYLLKQWLQTGRNKEWLRFVQKLYPMRC